MTQYELKLRKIAEELAVKKYGSFSGSNDATIELMITQHIPLAALCLEKMAEAYTKGYRSYPTNNLRTDLISLGYKKEGI